MRRHTGVWSALIAAVTVLTLAVPAAAEPGGGSDTTSATDTSTATTGPATPSPTETAPPTPTPTPSSTPTPTPTGSATPRSKGVPATFLGQLEELRTQATTLTTTLTTAQATASAAIASYTATTDAVQAALATAQQAKTDLVGAQAEVAGARRRVQIVARDTYVERIPHATTALLLTSDVDDVDFTVAALGYLANRGDDEYDRLDAARQRAAQLSDRQTEALAQAQKLQTTADTQRVTALTALGEVQTQQGAFLAAVTTLRDAAAKAAAVTALSPADQVAYQTFLAELNALTIGSTGIGSTGTGSTGGTTYVTGAPGLVPLPGTSWVKPLLSYTVSSCYCARWGTFHHGVDLAAPSGTPIYAVGAGTVVAAGPANGFGNWVVIDHHDGSFSIYGHMRVLATVVGQQVTAGTLIAYVGNEGESSGFHLHFEVRIGSYASADTSTDPTLWLAQRGVTL